MQPKNCKFSRYHFRNTETYKPYGKTNDETRYIHAKPL